MLMLLLQLTQRWRQPLLMLLLLLLLPLQLMQRWVLQADAA